MNINPNIYVNEILSGSRLFLAKAITLIESSSKIDRRIGRKIIKKLTSRFDRPKSIRLGISGIPGVGKSTFIENFGLMLVERGYKIAVLAIDPSSKISGGSIMADKTRMEKLSVHENAFIRPSPSGGTLGGVSRMTREVMVLCEAVGFDIIIVETVGVGQSETTVSSMVDFFLVLMLFEAGDELQGLKKGLIEMADMIAINKADGDNITMAARAKQVYRTAVKILNPLKYSQEWIPPVMTCSAINILGLDEIWRKILLHRKRVYQSGNFFKRRNDQSIEWMWLYVKEGIENYLLEKRKIKEEISIIEKDVKGGKVSSSIGAEKILSFLYN